MRRRIGLAEPRRTVHLQPEAAGGGAPRWAPYVAETPRIARAIEDLRVAQRDLARLPGIDGEDACAQQPVTRKLDERRIALLAHDRLVDPAGLRGVHRLALEFAVSLPEREVTKHGLARKRIEVGPFAQPGTRVAKPLLHGHSGDSSGDRHLHGAADPFDASAGEWADGFDPPLGARARGN